MDEIVRDAEMKIAIITGASSGMGREFALQMDLIFSNIDEFWLVARREKELEELAGALLHPCRVFALDLTKMGQVERLEYSIKLEGAKVCVLVNCAGYGIMGPFAEASQRDTIGMIQTNCEALTKLTHALIPHMIKNSRIIQLASSAAFLPQADFAVYAASKSYVLSFSRALGMELKKRQIYVTAVCPGPVDTPFFEIAERTGTTLALKKKVMAQPEAVVALALRDSYHRKSISVYGLPMKAFALVSKLLPHELILNVVEVLKK